MLIYDKEIKVNLFSKKIKVRLFVKKLRKKKKQQLWPLALLKFDFLF